ncbi:Uncharacterized protein HZ326_27501 [Fusarium oxysporum f. sp. albedinis]|nr:Uncharacterized protein HZ326_27501 [Fusarium oxysporum f. sp. albedinis]
MIAPTAKNAQTRTGQITFPSDPDSDSKKITISKKRSQSTTKGESVDRHRTKIPPPPKGDRLKNIPKEYQKYDKLFREELEIGVPKHSQWDHEINLTDNNLPFQKLYPLNERELRVQKEYINEMLAKGYIRESSSSSASSMFFIPKKNGKDRPIIDYRPVNAKTIKDRTPLPLITELKDRLQGKKIFIALDLKGAYNLIRVQTLLNGK